MVSQTMLYDDITRISEDYFGPVAPRFISRIVANHLNKKPEQVTAKDMPELINWVKLCMAMVTDEADTISEYIERLNKLAKQ